MRLSMKLKARRGATLVIAAVLIVVVGGMAAFAVDLARIYSGVNEMQTGADAGAMAGAIRLQDAPGLSPVSVVQTFASSNSAFGSAISIASGDVEGGIWNDSAKTFTTSGWPTANAVRVTSRTTPTLAFGRLMNRTSLNANRGGTAWIANQSTLDCIKPWGVPMGEVSTLLGGLSINTQAGVNALATLVSTAAGRYTATMILGPNISNPFGTPTSPDTTFLALTGASSSRKEYQNAIIGQNCEGTADYVVGGSDQAIAIQPGQGNGDVPRTTADAIELDLPPGQIPIGAVQTCKAQVSNTDATCYDPSAPGNVAGVTVTVAIATQSGVNSAVINTLMSFKLMCVFRGGNGGPGRSSVSEVCPWLTAAGRTANNYVEGTLVGYLIPSIAVVGNGNGLGNVIGGAQKLLLVR